MFPPDRRPQWKVGERKLIWPNGTEAQAFSAHEPEGFRGPQFDAAWVDELAKWKRGAEAWDMLQFALRLGPLPRACVTTTPRNVAVLKALLAAGSTVTSHAATEANRANLAQSFLDEVRSRYADTQLERQELDGVLVDTPEGALWQGAVLERARAMARPALDRIVVALDPAVSSGPGADACGIIVAGATYGERVQDWRAYVLADCTVQGVTPTGWATAAVMAMDTHGADQLVAEVNQGGQLVEEMIRQVDPMIWVKAVHASRGKLARAEPVAALYEQGRVGHASGLAHLEAQMNLMTSVGYQGDGSPDRLDAVVWAIHELLIAPASTKRHPRLRPL